jgi:putative transposase
MISTNVQDRYSREKPRGELQYEPVPESAENLGLMRLIHEQYLATPFYGSRRMAKNLTRTGHLVNRKRAQRLMRLVTASLG